MSLNATDDKEGYFQRWSEGFLERHWPLALIMALEILVVGGLYLFHLAWIRVQRQRAKNSAVMRLTEALSLELLRRFLPSAKVEKYRFRGMGKKKAMASISFEDISLQLPSGDMILSGVSGEFRAGRMCAILGPSGAGKTSLMNVLCGKASYATASGVVRFNGQEGDFNDYKTVMGFVPQEDVVHEGLTVGEQIRFSADLRNAYDTDANTRKLIAEDVLKVMQLDGLQNSIVGGLEHRGISGGQRKRVSIGLELAADPTMLFLDEPTSGLDAASSLAIVQSLKRMSQLGMTSVLVVHQPRFSLFSLFDDVLLLGKGGRTVYFGPPKSAKLYFERLGFVMPKSENPADWFMDLISGEVPNQKIPHFVPEMLFDIWELNKDRVQRKAREAEQAMLEVDEWQELVNRLDDDWPRISYHNAPSAMDPRREGVMREEDFVRLLKASVIDEEDDDSDVREAVSELLKRIGGPSACVATKKEVVEFLASLQGVVASDKELRRKPKAIAKKANKPPPPRLLVRTSPMSSPREEPEEKVEERARSAVGPGGRRLPTMILEEEDNAPKDVLVEPEPRKLSADPTHGAVCDEPSRMCSQAEDSADHIVETELIATTDFTNEEAGSETIYEYPKLVLAASERSEMQEVDDRSAAGALLPAKSSLSMATTSKSKARRPSEFVVFLAAGALSADFHQENDMLTVKFVGEGGTIEAWNMANPGLKLKKADHIVQVNHVYGAAEDMMEELLKLQASTLTVRAREHRRPSRRSEAEDCGSLTLLRQHSGSGSAHAIPRLNLQQAPSQALQVAGPRGLHGSLSEELKASSLSPSKAHWGRRWKESSEGEGSSCSHTSSEYSSAIGEVPRQALVRSIEEATLRKLSPRTRSVWSRRIDPNDAIAKQRVALADSPSCSEFTVIPSSDKLSWEVADGHARRSARSLKTTKSFTSAHNLRKHARNSKPPGFRRQLFMLLHRGSIQWWRHSWHRGLFLFVISGSSAILGLMDTFVVKEKEWQILPFLNLHTTLALLTAVFCLNVFSADRPVFWRERESGLNISAFFLSKILINTLDVLLQCFLLAAIYYMIRQPVISFELYFMPFVLVSFAASGLGYAVSTTFPVAHGPFVVAIIIFVVCGLLGHPLRVETMADGAVLEVIMDFLSITRWSVAYYWNNYSNHLDESSFRSDPATWQAIQGIEAIYEKPTLVSKFICGLRSEIFFLILMSVAWTFISYLALWLSGHQWHKKAQPWKQRASRAWSFVARLARLRLRREEPQASSSQDTDLV